MYVVSVAKELGRNIRSRKAFKSAGLDPTFVPAVPHSDSEIPKSFMRDFKRKCEYSLFLFFKRMIRKAKAEDLPHIILFEDDARSVVNNVKQKIENVLRDLPEDFGMCYLGCYFKRTSGGSVRVISPHVAQLCSDYRPRKYRIWGSHAIVIGRAHYDRILSFFDNPSTHVVDTFLVDNIVPNVPTFVATPLLFFQSSEGSDFSVGTSIHGTFGFANIRNESENWLAEKLKAPEVAPVPKRVDMSNKALSGRTRIAKQVFMENRKRALRGG